MFQVMVTPLSADRDIRYFSFKAEIFAQILLDPCVVACLRLHGQVLVVAPSVRVRNHESDLKSSLNSSSQVQRDATIERAGHCPSGRKYSSDHRGSHKTVPVGFRRHDIPESRSVSAPGVFHHRYKRVRTRTSSPDPGSCCRLYRNQTEQIEYVRPLRVFGSYSPVNRHASTLLRGQSRLFSRTLMA